MARLEFVLVDVSADDLTAASARITGTALDCARLVATEHLLGSLQSSGITIEGSAAALTDTLVRRDPSDPQFQGMAPYEQQWALLVVRFADAASSGANLIDRQAVDEARRRGVTWQAIADILGISQQSAHGRYATRAEGKARRRRAEA